MIPPRLIQAVRDRHFVPFVGAGLSKQSDPKHFPNWNELLERMICQSEELRYLDTPAARDLRSLLQRGRHLMVAEALASRIPRDFYHAFLEEQFDPPDASPSEAHKALFRLAPRFVITTNYDRLIENAFAGLSKKAMTVLDYSNAGAVQRKIQDERQSGKPFLYKIHGDIEDVSNIILTENDYRKLLYDESGYQTVLASIFIHFVVLFIGFSFSDEELMLHLGKLRYALKGSANPDYILFSDRTINNIEVERFRRDFGLEVITYEHDDTHSGILSFLNTLQSKIQELQ